MWPKPDEMKQMMESKQAHPEAGANCAWVPSPTAATLHAMHYHAVDVRQVQEKLAARELASLDDILTPPLGDPANLDAETYPVRVEQQCTGYSRLRGALDRSGRRLFQGSGYQRRRSDGGQGHAADFKSAHRKLAAAWRDNGGTSTRNLQAHGRSRRRTERR